MDKASEGEEKPQTPIIGLSRVSQIRSQFSEEEKFLAMRGMSGRYKEGG